MSRKLRSRVVGQENIDVMENNESTATSFECSDESPAEFPSEMLQESAAENPPSDSHNEAEEDNASAGKEDNVTEEPMDILSILLKIREENRGSHSEISKIRESQTEISKKLEETTKEVKVLKSLKIAVEELRKDMKALEKKFEIKLEEKTEEIRKELTTRMTTIEENVNQRISNEIETVRMELNDKTKEADSQTMKNFEEKLKEFQQEREEMKEALQAARTQPIIVNTSCQGSSDAPKFEKYLENPIQFLIKLKEYLRWSGKVNWGEQSSVIEKSFENQHSSWWMITEPSINSLEEFEERFRAKFWNDHIQDGVRERLKTGKFIRERRLNASEYFMRQMLIARNLQPALSDEEIIIKIARHYGVGLEAARFSRNVRTVVQMEQLLQEWSTQNIDMERSDVIEKKKPREENAPEQYEERGSPHTKRRRQESDNYSRSPPARNNSNYNARGNYNYNRRGSYGRDGNWNRGQNEYGRNDSTLENSWRRGKESDTDQRYDRKDNWRDNSRN